MWIFKRLLTSNQFSLVTATLLLFRMYIYIRKHAVYVWEEKDLQRKRLQSRMWAFVLPRQPLLNMSLAQNHQFNLATILFSGVHGSSLDLSWQSEQLNFPEW